MVNKSKPEDFKTVGEWSWRPDLLMKKVRQGEPHECWRWLGSSGPHSTLFGALKNGRRQMSQATRILYRELYNEDCEDKEIKHTCGNKYCVNWNHWLVRDINRHPEVKAPVKQAKLKPVKPKKRNKWWEEE